MHLTEEFAMNSKIYLLAAAVVGAAFGAAAVQGLHAQGKPKAYVVSDLEILDVAAQKAFAPQIEAAQTAAGGRNLHTAGGKVVSFEGQAPKLVAISEWQSLDQAVAFYKSKAWNDLQPQQQKAVKTNSRFAVEALK
jgi:uncharacterized protein (DUF1330 family)